MDEKAKEISKILKVISNKNRLLILCCLEEREYTVSELNERIKSITMSALSQHLSPVSYTHLDVYKRQGKSCTMGWSSCYSFK